MTVVAFPQYPDGGTRLKTAGIDYDNGFTFTPDPPRPSLEKQASGELLRPSEVAKRRHLNAQRHLSNGTGEHAGHLIGTQFGAPGDIRNLGLQNPNMNTYAPKHLQETFQGVGGSYLALERAWAVKLEAGARIRVLVRDLYRPNDPTRPYTRKVRYWVMEKGHSDWVEMRAPEFVNFSSPQSRTVAGR